MVDSGKRLVILMENRDGGVRYPWLLDGFHWTQDTPFDFRRPSLFSCAPNRGPEDAPLFLLNHWITNKAREVTNATLVNARSVLLGRAEECAQERGQLPNFVAVDFYDRGDLMGVVDTLNGPGRPEVLPRGEARGTDGRPGPASPPVRSARDPVRPGPPAHPRRRARQRHPPPGR
jgi:hypothetical protein